MWWKGHIGRGAGCAFKVCFGVCFVFVCVVVVWLWPVWCGDSLGAVVVC